MRRTWTALLAVVSVGWFAACSGSDEPAEADKNSAQAVGASGAAGAGGQDCSAQKTALLALAEDATRCASVEDCAVFTSTTAGWLSERYSASTRGELWVRADADVPALQAAAQDLVKCDSGYGQKGSLIDIGPSGMPASCVDGACVHRP